MDFSQLTQLAPFIACFGILYFMVLRPQQQKMKKHREFLAALKKGDHVVLGGGIEGTVEEAQQNSSKIRVSIAPGTVVAVRRDLIVEVLASTEKMSE